MSAASGPGPTMLPAGPGRRYTARRAVRLGDVLPSGAVRLDALARYLQDIASDDGVDAGIDRHLAWVVRRSAIRVHRRPTYRERLTLATWASATGSRWAERRTTVIAGGDAAVEASAIWVCVEATTMRPARLSDRFWQMYGEAAGDRTVSARLAHPEPPDRALAAMRPWPLRLADVDLFDHVNNAVTWAAAEDEVTRVAPAARITWAEVEFRAPVDRSAELMLASRIDADLAQVWLMADRAVLASAAMGLGPADRAS